MPDCATTVSRDFSDPIPPHAAVAETKSSGDDWMSVGENVTRPWLSMSRLRRRLKGGPSFARLRSSESQPGEIGAESDLFPIEAWTSEFLKRIAVLILKYNGSGPADLASFEETFQ